MHKHMKAATAPDLRAAPQLLLLLLPFLLLLLPLLLLLVLQLTPAHTCLTACPLLVVQCKVCVHQRTFANTPGCQQCLVPILDCDAHQHRHAC